MIRPPGYITKSKGGTQMSTLNSRSNIQNAGIIAGHVVVESLKGTNQLVLQSGKVVKVTAVTLTTTASSIANEVYSQNKRIWVEGEILADLSFGLKKIFNGFSAIKETSKSIAEAMDKKAREIEKKQ